MIVELSRVCISNEVADFKFFVVLILYIQILKLWECITSNEDTFGQSKLDMPDVKHWDISCNLRPLQCGISGRKPNLWFTSSSCKNSPSYPTLTILVETCTNPSQYHQCDVLRIGGSKTACSCNLAHAIDVWLYFWEEPYHILLYSLMIKDFLLWWRLVLL